MSELQRETTKDRVAQGLRRRYWQERAFKLIGLAATLVGILFLGLFFATLIANGYTAVLQTRILLDVPITPEEIDPAGTRADDVLQYANYQGLVRDALHGHFPEVSERSDLRELYSLLSPGGGLELKSM